jgi:hypothetical protein
MRVTPIGAFTVFLLLFVVTGGLYGFFWGFALGQDALGGVTQLDIGFNRRPVRRSDGSLSEETLNFISEPEVITNLKKQFSNGGKAPDPPKPQPSSQPSPVSKVLSQVGFPVTAQNGGVFIQIRSIRLEGESIFLDTQLRNDTSQPIRFLYNSFLEVKDDKGNALSATVDGLPSDLEALSPPTEGTIRIPKVLLDKVTHLSITLTDYPDQKISLELSDIPINLQ